jgi:hypothetical protein
MKEIWKDIEGYEGRYQVSNYGNVKSLYQEYHGGHGKKQLIIRPEKLLALNKNNHGYSQVALCKDGKSKSKKVHRLVAEAFFINYGDKPQVNHIDGDRLNNHVNNLEWCTSKENIVHGFEKLNSKRACGVRQHLAKLNDETIKEIRKSSKSPYELAPEYGVNVRTIYRIKNNETWKHVV